MTVQTNQKISSMPQPSGDIIQAAVMDEKQVQHLVKQPEKQLEHDNNADIQKKNEEQKKIEALKQLNQKLAQASEMQAQEQSKALKITQELQKTKEEEQAHLAELRMEKEKERKALEALKKEKAKEEKRLMAMDEKRQEEQDRATQMRLEREKEERHRKELEKKKKESLEVARKLEEDKKQAALRAKEEARIASENAQRLQLAQGEFRKYESIIKDKVKGSWVRPSGLPPKLQCKLEINAMPDGEVVNVKVVNSSGNEAFDQSAIAAVRKAVPLPFPQGEPDVMNLFRHFTLEFIPDENSEND